MLIYNCFVDDGQGNKFLIVDENGYNTVLPLPRTDQRNLLLVIPQTLTYYATYFFISCGIDQYVMRTPEYVANLTKAQQETHVFKYADKVYVTLKYLSHGIYDLVYRSYLTLI